MIKITKAEDVKNLIGSLRQGDLDEITAMGSNELNSLMNGFLLSDECYSVFVNNHIIGMFGFNQATNSIWFLGSDECEKCKRQWIREASYYIKHFLEITPILTNTVSTKNKLHINWLKRMGAIFSAPYLINDQYFQDFYIIKGE
jgi:hypothetical protein